MSVPPCALRYFGRYAVTYVRKSVTLSLSEDTTDPERGEAMVFQRVREGRRVLPGAALACAALLLGLLPVAAVQAAGTVHCKLPSSQAPGYICQGTDGDDIIYGTNE